MDVRNELQLPAEQCAAETSGGGGMAVALMLLLLLHTLTLNCTLRCSCQKLKTQQSDGKSSGSDEIVKVETLTVLPRGH